MIKPGVTNSPNSISRWETPHLSEQPAVKPKVEEEDLGKVRQRAVEEGYEEGYKKGLAKAEAELNKKSATIEKILTSITHPFAELDHQVFELLVQMTGKIARSLVKRELRTEPETIMALIRDTVVVLNNTTDKIRIHLHPDDALVIHNLTRTATEHSRWDILEDPLLARGDCKVSSLDSVVIGDLQTRIHAIITQCLGDERA
ncbi:MAG: FliH/SctL family protein [Pseudomonadota bacterium]